MAHPRTTKPFFRRALLLAASVAGVTTLAAAGLVASAGPAVAADTATINGASTFQTITGFGASEAFGEAQSQWAGGFVAGVTIANTGSSAINGWTLKFTFPGDQKITNAWNGTETQSGEHVTITNAGYNGTIAPGGSTSLGFQGTWTSSDAVPAAFTVNGTACTA